MSRSFLPDTALPLFPLQTVLFPDGLLELKIFETRYLDLMARCMREQAPFGVVALRSGGETARSAAGASVSLFDVGTLAGLIEVDSPETNILLVRCRGGQRFRLGAVRQEPDGLWVGDAAPVADDPAVAPSATHANVVKSLVDAVATLSAQGAEPFLQPHRFDDAGWVANRWCEILPLPIDAKHRLLSLDPLSRLDIVDSLMRVRHTPH
ncbi:MAG TPA: LON peptidase substrate-binding domain-containing protein [Caldimonas sp.]